MNTGEELHRLYFEIVQTSSVDTLLQIPHLHKGLYPTGFIVRSSNPRPMFLFTVCPLFFISMEETNLPGQNPHDVAVKWKQGEDVERKLKADAEATAQAIKVAAEAKLAALGLTTDDLKALGLGGN